MSRHHPFQPLPLSCSCFGLLPEISVSVLRGHVRLYQSHVAHLNRILSDLPQLQSHSLEQLLQSPDSDGEVAALAGSVFVHELYYACVGKERPMNDLSSFTKAFEEAFSSLEEWEGESVSQLRPSFGSGFLWLAVRSDGSLCSLLTENYHIPDLLVMWPVLCIDLWEHAFYPRYRRREQYLKNWISLINWRAVEQHYIYGLLRLQNIK